MVRASIFKEDLSIGEYTPEDMAEFSAYLDIQLEEEEFIPFDSDITKKCEQSIDEVYHQIQRKYNK